MAKPGEKLRNGHVLPPVGKRRADLIFTFSCGRCGAVQETVDMNDAGPFREHVRAGREPPPEAWAAVRRYFATQGRRETCACGAVTEFHADHQKAAPVVGRFGVRPVDKTLPIVDRVRRVGGKLVVEGRFLDGTSLAFQRGRAADGKQHAPLRPTLVKRGQTHEVDGLTVLPAAGDVLVVEVANQHGNQTLSIHVTG